MEMNVKVTVDLGDKTLALFNGFLFANKIEAVSKPSKEEPSASKADTVKPAKEQTPAKEATMPSGWDDMDEDDKLELIKSEVTKHTKKGKSADVKFLLSHFDAGRASELAPEAYAAFFEAITRYGKGEDLEKIIQDRR